MTTEVTSEPAVEPLTLDQAKLHLRQDLTVDDNLITAAIVAARRYAENFMHRPLITQTIKMTATGFYGPRLRLPVGNVQSISAVEYTDTTGADQTLASDQYQLVKSVTPFSIAPAYGLTWPSVRSDYDSVRVSFVAGYGDAATDIPADVLQAVRLLLAHFYENRADEVTGTQISKFSLGAEALLQPHVLHI